MAERAEGDPLAAYREMRDASRTPEPVPAAGPVPTGNDDTFVIQEHHARSLHWDVRLERGGVLVSWAVPKGLPLHPKDNRLAVHTEDHPIDYGSFEGDIPTGEYGGGSVILWDRGRYELEKWTDREVKVVFHGQRATGRYVFFRTRGRDWMVHRMDPPPIPNWERMPVGLRPMMPSPGRLPPGGQRRWAYEPDWGGVRVLVAVEGGRTKVTDVAGKDAAPGYPELRRLGPALGSRACLLDGVVVVVGADGRVDSELLERRPAAAKAPGARAAREAPVTLLAFDVLHLDGLSTIALPYRERRRLLESLPLKENLAPVSEGTGREALVAARRLGSGVIAKRRSSPYEPGVVSPDWIRVSRETR